MADIINKRTVTVTLTFPTISLPWFGRKHEPDPEQEQILTYAQEMLEDIQRDNVERLAEALTDFGRRRAARAAGQTHQFKGGEHGSGAVER